MKTIILKASLWIISMAVAMTTMAQTSTFPDLSARKDVTTVYVSKAMLNSFGKSTNKIKQFSVRDMAKSISALEIIDCEERAAVKEAKKALKHYIRKHSTMEILAKITEDGEEYAVYGLPASRDGFYSEILMSSWDDHSDDMQLIVIKGMISINDIAKFKMPRNSVPANSRTIIQRDDTTIIISGKKLYKLPHTITNGITGEITDLEQLKDLQQLKNLEQLKGLDSLKRLKNKKNTDNIGKKRKTTTHSHSTRTVTRTDVNGNTITIHMDEH